MANQQIALDIIAKDLATATLQRVNANVDTFAAKTARASTGSGQFAAGLSKAGNALNNLAGDLVGVNNKVANLAEGMLQFVGGGALVSGVAIGVTAIAGALMHLTKEARDAEAAWTRWLASVQRQSPLAEIGKQLDALQAKIKAPDFGGYRRLMEFFGIGQSRDDLLRRAGVVQQAYSQIFASMQEQAVANGQKVAERAAREAAKAGDFQADRLRFVDLGSGVPESKRRSFFEGDREPEQLRKDFNFLPDPAIIAPTFTALDELRSLVLDLAGSFIALGASIGDTFAEALASGEGVLGSIKAVQKQLAQQARTHGAYDAVAALSALGRGLFGDPTQFAAAAKLAASSAAWFALSAALGGGGGSGVRAASGGGAGSGRSGLERDQRDIAEAQGEVRIELRAGYLDSTNPQFQDFLVETLQGAGRRRVTVAYT